MESKARWTHAWLVLAVGAVVMAFTLGMSGQVQTKTNTTTDAASVNTKVENGEVVTVSGNDLVVKMADGSLRHVADVPDSARVTVWPGTRDPRSKAGHEASTHHNHYHNSQDHYNGAERNRKGVLCESAPFCNPDHGGWKEPAVQDSQESEIQHQRTNGRCVGFEKGDERLSNQGR